MPDLAVAVTPCPRFSHLSSCQLPQHVDLPPRPLGTSHQRARPCLRSNPQERNHEAAAQFNKFYE